MYYNFLMISLKLVKDTSLTFPTVLNVPIPAKNINKCNCLKKQSTIGACTIY